jgi:hypothetical protein
MTHWCCTKPAAAIHPVPGADPSSGKKYGSQWTGRAAGGTCASPEINSVEERDGRPGQGECREVDRHGKPAGAGRREDVRLRPKLFEVAQRRVLGHVDQRTAKRSAARQAIDPGNE